MKIKGKHETFEDTVNKLQRDAADQQSDDEFGESDDDDD